MPKEAVGLPEWRRCRGALVRRVHTERAATGRQDLTIQHSHEREPSPPGPAAGLGIGLAAVAEASASQDSLVVIASLLNSVTLSGDQVLDLSLRTLAAHTHADAGAIFLLDVERQELVVRHAAGAYDEPLRGRRFASGEGAAGWAMAHGELLLEDAAADPRGDPTFDLDSGFASGSLLCVPLRVKARTIGALLLARRRGAPPFASEDRTLVRAAAHQIAFGHENVCQAAALTEARARVHELEQLQEQFLVRAAHELRTPITLLSGQLELLAVELAAAGVELGAATSLVGLRTAIDRLEEATQRLLDVSSLEEGRLVLQLEPADFAELLAESRRGLAPLAATRGITLSVEADGLEPLVCLLDRRRVVLVLDELIYNAIRFTPDGGWIRVAARRQSDSLRVTVTDSGVGIPAAERERIFQPLVALQRVEHHSSSSLAFLSGGLGLGLTVARGAVAAHGGWLWVADSGGPGSEFVFTLPLGGPVAGDP